MIQLKAELDRGNLKRRLTKTAGHLEFGLIEHHRIFDVLADEPVHHGEIRHTPAVAFSVDGEGLLKGKRKLLHGLKITLNDGTEFSSAGKSNIHIAGRHSGSVALALVKMVPGAVYRVDR